MKIAVPDLPIFASGGIRDGVEIAKTVALGAAMAGMASPFLKAADQSLDAIIQEIDRIKREIQISMFAAGAGNLDQLSKTPLFIYRPLTIYQDHT